MIASGLGDLKAMVLGPITAWLTTDVIIAGITWILSLLTPASAFIKACKAIFDIVMFFIQRGSQIMALVNAIIGTIGAVASGNVGAIAGAVENALARSIPVAIGFLASLLGLGGIAEKITGFIQKIQAPVNKAIDWVIGKAKSLFKVIADKAKGLAGKVGDKLGFGKGKEREAASHHDPHKPDEARDTHASDAHGHQHGHDPKPGEPLTPHQKLDKAVTELRPRIEALLQRGVPGLFLRARLQLWRLQYGLSALSAERQGEGNVQIIARVNPWAVVGQGVVPKGETLRVLVHEVVQEIHAQDDVVDIARHMDRQRDETNDPVTIPNGPGWAALQVHYRRPGRPVPRVGTVHQYEVGDSSTTVSE